MKINIRTSLGNIVGVEINKKLEEITSNDIKPFVLERFGEIKLSILGWTPFIVKKFKVIGFCRDCTGIDPMGCNDGEPFDLGEWETIEEAREAKNHHSEEAGPYYAEIYDEENRQIE
jgi:hypothetical protein